MPVHHGLQSQDNGPIVFLKAGIGFQMLQGVKADQAIDDMLGNEALYAGSS